MTESKLPSLEEMREDARAGLGSECDHRCKQVLILLDALEDAQGEVAEWRTDSVSIHDCDNCRAQVKRERDQLKAEVAQLQDSERHWIEMEHEASGYYKSSQRQLADAEARMRALELSAQNARAAACKLYLDVKRELLPYTKLIGKESGLISALGDVLGSLCGRAEAAEARMGEVEKERDDARLDLCRYQWCLESAGQPKKNKRPPELIEKKINPPLKLAAGIIELIFERGWGYLLGSDAEQFKIGLELMDEHGSEMPVEDSVTSLEQHKIDQKRVEIREDLISKGLVKKKGDE